MNNYIRTIDKSPAFVHFFYVDSKDRAVLKLLAKHKCFTYENGVYSNTNKDYLVVPCRVRKKNVSRFLKAMDEAITSMPLLGYLHYTEWIKDFQHTCGSNTPTDMLNNMDDKAYEGDNVNSKD